MSPACYSAWSTVKELDGDGINLQVWLHRRRLGHLAGWSLKAAADMSNATNRSSF